MARDDSPSAVFAEVAEQHDGLREMMDHCEDLADALDAGAADPAQLLREVARLRVAFDTHNRLEEHLLVLLDAQGRATATDRDRGGHAATGAARVSRKVEQHVDEHRAMGQRLGSTTTAELRAVVASLRDHLESEERGLLARTVVRDDVTT